jgi:hypothetical protein
MGYEFLEQEHDADGNQQHRPDEIASPSWHDGWHRTHPSVPRERFCSLLGAQWISLSARALLVPGLLQLELELSHHLLVPHFFVVQQPMNLDFQAADFGRINERHNQDHRREAAQRN